MPNEGKIMNMTKRILLSIGILAVDLAVFFLPLTAFFLVYILTVNPPWFRDFLKNLDDPDSTGNSGDAYTGSH
jgi:hypothetical protein